MRGDPRLLLGVVAALLASACLGIQPRSDWDHEASFEDLDSFAILPPENVEQETDSDDIDPYRSPIVADRIGRAAAAALTAGGYVETGKDRADFWVAAHISTKEKVEVFTTGAAVTHRGYWIDGRTYGTSYTEGTLILDVIDPASGRLLWRGWASEELRGSGQSPERVQEVVDAILGLFPPAPSPPPES
ncbi:MAG: DUF4136 domain-containing protein [Myxococcota bacterium]